MDLFEEPSTGLAELNAVPAIGGAVLDAARRAMSDNSWRALKADLKVFAAWCAERHASRFPAAPETIARFLQDQAEHGKKAATLQRYTSSIARAHALAGLADPTKAELVRLELKAQRRALGVRQRQAKGLRFRGDVADPLAAAGPVGVCVEAMLAAAPETLQGLRDRALLSLAFDTGLRRSEVVAVRVHHVEKGTAGAGRLFVPRSKADQEGAGAYAYLSERTMTFLAAWREQAAVTEGAVFRRLHKSVDKHAAAIWTPGAQLTAQSVVNGGAKVGHAAA